MQNDVTEFVCGTEPVCLAMVRSGNFAVYHVTSPLLATLTMANWVTDDF
jgi:hypothetical protein